MSEDILFAREDQIADLDAVQAEDVVDTLKFLVFMCDDLKLGIFAEYVVEILTNQPITYLPMLPEFIRGIINMRGQMVPIVDVRIWLGQMPQSEEGLVVVLNIGDTQLGILVDAVDQMVDIPKASILPVPAHNAQLLVSGMCSLPDGSGTMMVLDCDQLLPHD